MNLWLLVIGMGIITFLLRLSLILGANRLALPDALQQGLKYAPPAVLSAIILPELVSPAGVIDLTPGNSRLIAGLIAIAIAWRSQNVILTIAGGMISLWLLQWIASSAG